MIEFKENHLHMRYIMCVVTFFSPPCRKKCSQLSAHREKRSCHFLPPSRNKLGYKLREQVDNVSDFIFVKYEIENQ